MRKFKITSPYQYNEIQATERDTNKSFTLTVYITDNDAGQRLIKNFLDSLVEYVASMQIKSCNKVVITA